MLVLALLCAVLFVLAFKYGAFIQNVIDFLIIAFCIFMMVKAMNKLTRKKEEVVEELLHDGQGF